MHFDVRGLKKPSNIPLDGTSYIVAVICYSLYLQSTHRVVPLRFRRLPRCCGKRFKVDCLLVSFLNVFAIFMCVVCMMDWGSEMVWQWHTVATNNREPRLIVWGVPWDRWIIFLRVIECDRKVIEYNQNNWCIFTAIAMLTWIQITCLSNSGIASETSQLIDVWITLYYLPLLGKF